MYSYLEKMFFFCNNLLQTEDFHCPSLCISVCNMKEMKVLYLGIYTLHVYIHTITISGKC